MSDDFVPGQRLGDYEILGVLGAGGMGRVYKVRNVISDRVEAMKVLLANLVGQKELADRFLREIKLLAVLHHPNIASLYSALTLDNQLVMLMEYVDGVTLLSRLQSGPIPPSEAINYSEQILSALGYAHKLNVIHRDVKPSNMMLSPDGVVKLMDFGIARPNNDVGMTLTGTTLGSLNYMSPEQVRGSEVDARSDVYSFGVSLYEMVTGQLPFQGNSNYSVMSAHIQQAPRPPITVRPDLPKGLNEIILMSMAKDPQDRFQTAEAFANALKTVPSNPTRAATTPATAPAVTVPANRPAASAARTASTVPIEPVAVSAPANPGPPSPRSVSGHRGIYMALGGLLVIAILVAASLYVPHRIRTHASPASRPAPASPVESMAQPATAAPSPDISTPAADAGPAITPSAHLATPARSAPPQTPPPQPQRQPDAATAEAQSAAQQEAQEEAARKAAELKEATKQADQLNARAAAISQSLDNLRHQQAAQGYGLRGDMAAAEELLKTNLSKAQAALDQGDGAKAKEYLDLAAAQAEKLEGFLGH
jgi:eukaryotic-like serine/threonine-protein kinase